MAACVATSQPDGGFLVKKDLTSGESRANVQPKPSKPDNDTLYTVDDLVRQRAQTLASTVVVSYPSSGIDYVDYTMRQLDVFAYRVARYYEKHLPVRKSSADKPAVVAMLGPSNLEYLITMLALMKLGHTILFLSTRISQEAIASLLKTTDAKAILADAAFTETAKAVLASEESEKIAGVQLLDIVNRPMFEFSIDDVPLSFDTRLDSGLDHTVETSHYVYIIHSSGSTGLPKPIFQTHKAALVNYSISMNMRAFITLPLYHNHGICNLFRAVYSGRSIHIYNATLPLTTGYLETILGRYHFEIFYGVPYALKLLSESESGIKLLRELKVVMYGGSACPDELGNKLVDAGVNLVGHYGATEVGQLMTSFRPAGDMAWNYVRETDKLSPYLHWLPRGPNLFECCVREGWPAKLTSNMPDGSYATKDLFEPHPTIPRAWKYIARLDDTIALVNGEKFSPVSLEGCVRSDSWVVDAVAFGAGRPFIGMLIVPAPSTKGKSLEAILEHIWPVVESANKRSEAYGRLAKNMIRILPHGTDYPRTDKGSIIRQAFYRAFSSEIDAAYDDADKAINAADAKDMTVDEIKEFLRSTINTALGKGTLVTDDTADLFALGMDSLQSIQLRQDILRNVDVGGQKLGNNVVFDYPSIEKLSTYLHGLKTGKAANTLSVEGEMGSLVEKYSALHDVPQSPRTSVVVTGSTGSLGAHVVARLAADPSIQRIYCLVRAKDSRQSMSRVRTSLLERRVYHTMPLEQRQKLTALPFDQADLRLGLPETAYWKIARGLRAVIHCAWAVNFNMRLSSFERDCIAGVHNLLSLCLAGDKSQPAAFSFCSSVSAMARFPGQIVPETLPEFSWAQGMGYAQSKAVAEHICMRAAQTRGIPARVLRVGQIIADTRFGLWNATEAIPMMLQSALTIGALPRLPENPSWLPVDTVAQAVMEIGLAPTSSGFVTNVTNSQTFDWTADLLPALRAAGLVFEEVSPREWVRRLRASNPDPEANPPIKLVDFFASKYDRDEFTPSKTYATEIACKYSPTLQTAPVLDAPLVVKFVQRFLSTAWKAGPKNSPTAPGAHTGKKVAIIVAGPCGSGKSTVGERLAKILGGAFVEGDALHTRDAIARMGAGVPLTDDDRFSWLARIRQYTREAAYQLGYDVVVVSCSVLHRSYRDSLRSLREKRAEEGGDTVEQPLDVMFIDLQASDKVLQERVAKRTGHYMTEKMVAGQVQEYEAIGEDEEDIVPVDAHGGLEDVLEEVSWAVHSLM